MLRRWRGRANTEKAKTAGETFDGCRLPPGTWSLLNACAKAGLRLDSAIDPTDLKLHLDAARQTHPTWRSPTAVKFVHVIVFLRQKSVLASVLARTRTLQNPGVPDLFLWRQDRNGSVAGQFIEVKRYVQRTRVREAVSREQKEELQFLKSLGLKARVVYLLER